MEFATCFGEMILTSAVKAAWQQVRYAVYYKRNIRELRGKLDRLVDRQSTVNRQIDEATRNGEMIEVEVQNWMVAVDGTREMAQQMYDKEREERESRCPNPKSRYQLGKRATEMATEVDTLLNQSFARISYRQPVQALPDMALIGESNEGFDTRVLIVNEIMEALRDPNVKRIGLCGIGGVGKTTTAKEVARKVKGDMFNTVIMVEVTENPNRERIQREIAVKVGMTLDDKETEDVRASRLHERLKQETNMLLILDDLWEKLQFHKIGIPSDSRVLLTSRMDRLLADQMECKKVIKVDVMSEDEAWKLFTKEIAELPNDNEIRSIAKEIVGRCGRLPVRIVAAAGTLKNKKIDEWRDVLQRLKSPLQRNNTGIEEADGIFKASYDRLSQESKPIFLLSAILSHSPLIKDLMMCSVGLDLLQGVNTMEGALVRIHSLIKKLKASNLLLDSSDNSRFAIHDVIRDVALSIASNEEPALVLRNERLNRWLDKNLQKEYNSMCLDNCDINDQLPKDLSCPNLQFFLLNSKNSDLTIPSTFFLSTNKLKVMGFTNMHFSCLPSFQSLQDELQTLCLHSCVLEDIAEIRNLKSLTVLSLADSTITQLPWELSQLTSLQMLNLANCSKLEVIPAKLLSSLKGLEVLDMRSSFKQWEAEGDSPRNGNASVDELKHLTNLSSLTVQIPDASILPKNLFKDIPLERYEIVIGEEYNWWESNEYQTTLNVNGIFLDDGIRKLFENVEVLNLGDVLVNTKVLCDLHGREFLKLKRLNIRKISYQFDYVICNSTGSVASFSELVEIVIEDCESMEAFVVSTQQNSVSNEVIVFHQLLTLKMSNLPKLLTFYLVENATNNECNKESKSLFDSKVSFPKLNRIELKSLKRLIPSIWDDQLPQNSFSNLETLIVENCGFVERLIPFHVLKSLSHLEELEVCDCKSLVIVFDFEELNNQEIQLSWAVPLRKLKLNGLPKLKHVWSNDSQEMEFFHEKVVQNLKELKLDGELAMMIWNAQFLPVNLFQSVEELSLKLDGSVSFAHGLHNNRFPNLQKLNLSGSVKEKEVIPTQLLNERPQQPQNLQTLIVWKCDELINLGPSIISFANLTDIQVRRCFRLSSLMRPSTSRSLVQLTKLTISNCDEIEEIIRKQEEEEEDDVENEIVFQKLESLTLERLPRLRSFCSHNYTFKFPSLEQVIIIGCERMSMMFCAGDIHTPSLEAVQYGRKWLIWAEYEKLVEKNLNTTIQQLFTAKVTKLELHPEMRNIWMEKVSHHMPFSRLEDLIVDNCDFLSEYVIPTHLIRFLRMLNVLEVRNCHAIKTIFDLKGTDLDEETHNLLANIRLKKLKLHNLPNLKCVWIEDLDDSTCFQHLDELYVGECESLRNIFVASIAKGLGQLEKLSIVSCGVEEMIAKDKTSKESPNFVFPQLSYLKLDKLSNLKCFYPERCTFEWPQLTTLFVSQCENLNVFGTEMTSITESDREDEVPPLFLVEKVIPNLQSLSLSQKDIVTFERNGQFQAELFHGVKELCLESFVGESIAFPYDFLAIGRFPNLNELHVNQSSFEEIFPSQVQHVDDLGEIAPFKKLYLANLDQLKSIWNDDNVDSQLPSIAQNLESLEVECCCSLTNLTPSSASLENLTYLKVSGCHQLTYLVTTSTAKSLVNLIWLEITDCEKMEEIITNENNDAEAGAITFNKLMWLELTSLPILKSFCSENQSLKFPYLEYLTIKGCHQMKMFCHGVLETPRLEGLETEEGRTPLEGDLNKTIELLISDKDG